MFTYVYIYICIYIYLYIYVYTYIYIYTYMYIYVYIYTHVYTYMHVCICLLVYKRLHQYYPFIEPGLAKIFGHDGRYEYGDRGKASQLLDTMQLEKVPTDIEVILCFDVTRAITNTAVQH